MFAIEARDLTGGFAISRSLFQIGAFIARDFSLRHGNLGFQLSIFPMQIEKDEGASSNLGFAIKLIDFGAVEQKFPYSFGRGNLMTGTLVGLDVGIIKKGFAILDTSESIINV